MYVAINDETSDDAPIICTDHRALVIKLQLPPAEARPMSATAKSVSEAIKLTHSTRTPRTDADTTTTEAQPVRYGRKTTVPKKVDWKSVTPETMTKAMLDRPWPADPLQDIGQDEATVPAVTAAYQALVDHLCAVQVAAVGGRLVATTPGAIVSAHRNGAKDPRPVAVFMCILLDRSAYRLHQQESAVNASRYERWMAAVETRHSSLPRCFCSEPPPLPTPPGARTKRVPLADKEGRVVCNLVKRIRAARTLPTPAEEARTVCKAAACARARLERAYEKEAFRNAIQRRDEAFAAGKGACFRNAIRDATLPRTSNAAVTRLSVDDESNPGETRIVDEPRAVLDILKKTFEDVAKDPRASDDDSRRAAADPLNEEAPHPSTPHEHAFFAPVDEDAVEAAIQDMGRGKASADYIATESILLSGTEALRRITVIINIGLRSGARIIPSQWRKGLIFPIPKDEEASFAPRPDRLRPITLLAAGYRIFATLMYRRLVGLRIALGCIHHPAQTAFQAGLDALSSVGTLVSLIDNARETGRTIYIMCADLQKAYDSALFDSLWVALRRKGIPETVVCFFRHLYSDLTAAVITGHGITHEFVIGRGVRQGDPISCELYLFFHDMLGEEVWSPANRLHGFPMHVSASDRDRSAIARAPPVRVPGLLYADDTNALSDSKAGIQALANVIVAALARHHVQLNRAKTVLLVVRPKTTLLRRHRETISVGGVSVTELPEGSSMRYLGVFLTAGRDLWAKQRSMHAAMINEAAAVLRHKRLSWQQVKRVLDVVVAPRLLYGMEAGAIASYTQTELDRLNNGMLRALRLKINAGPGTNNAALRTITGLRLLEEQTFGRVARRSWSALVAHVPTRTELESSRRPDADQHKGAGQLDALVLRRRLAQLEDKPANNAVWLDPQVPTGQQPLREDTAMGWLRSQLRRHQLRLIDGNTTAGHRAVNRARDIRQLGDQSHEPPVQPAKWAVAPVAGSYQWSLVAVVERHPDGLATLEWWAQLGAENRYHRATPDDWTPEIRASVLNFSPRTLRYKERIASLSVIDVTEERDDDNGDLTFVRIAEDHLQRLADVMAIHVAMAIEADQDDDDDDDTRAHVSRQACATLATIEPSAPQRFAIAPPMAEWTAQDSTCDIADRWHATAASLQRDANKIISGETAAACRDATQARTAPYRTALTRVHPQTLQAIAAAGRQQAPSVLHLLTVKRLLSAVCTPLDAFSDLWPLPPRSRPVPMAIDIDDAAWHHVYVDASTSGGNTACAAVCLDTWPIAVVSKLVDGDNNLGELLAYHQAATWLPNDWPLAIHSDSRYAMNAVRQMLEAMRMRLQGSMSPADAANVIACIQLRDTDTGPGRAERPGRQQRAYLRTSHTAYAAAVVTLLLQRSAPTRIVKVKAHDGHPGNGLADAAAKIGVELDQVPTTDFASLALARDRASPLSPLAVDLVGTEGPLRIDPWSRVRTSQQIDAIAAWRAHSSQGRLVRAGAGTWHLPTLLDIQATTRTAGMTLSLACGSLPTLDKQRRQSKRDLDATCLLCGLADETMWHLAIECQDASDDRAKLLDTVVGPATIKQLLDDADRLIDDGHREAACQAVDGGDEEDGGRSSATLLPAAYSLLHLAAGLVPIGLASTHDRKLLRKAISAASDFFRAIWSKRNDVRHRQHAPQRLTSIED